VALSEESRAVIAECVAGCEPFTRARMTGAWIEDMGQVDGSRMTAAVYGLMRDDRRASQGSMFVVLCDDIPIGWKSPNGWRTPTVFYGVGVTAYQNVLRWAIAQPVRVST
jgi:hypothetical protein